MSLNFRQADLSRYYLIGFGFVLILGFILRVYGLGRLGFIHNEDYVVISANSILQNYVPLFPSEVIYPRAIPYSYLVSFLIKIFGFNEFIIRLPSAIFSTLSIGVTYLLGKKLMGSGVGLLGAFFMAISDWEIMVGRTARMYAMFSFFFLLSVFLMFSIIVDNKKKYRVWSIVSTIMTCLTHQLGGILIFIYFVFGFFFRKDTEKRKFLALSMLLVLIFAALDNRIGGYSYGKVNALVKEALSDEDGYLSSKIGPSKKMQVIEDKHLKIFLDLKKQNTMVENLIYVVMGFTLVGGACAFFRVKGERNFIIFLVLILFSLYIHQIMVSIYLLFSYMIASKWFNQEGYWKRIAFLLILIAFFSLLWLGIDGLINRGEEKWSLVQSLKPLLTYPPNFGRFYVERYPVMSFLSFLGGSVIILRYLFGRPLEEKQYLIIFFLVPMLAMGFHPTSLIRFYERYANFLNPYFILLFSYGLVWCSETFWVFGKKLNWNKSVRVTILLIFIFPILVLTAGFNIGKSFAILNMDYGNNKAIIDSASRLTFFYADHKGPSLFVKENYGEGDIIIVMDILAHYVYFPKADYQLTLSHKGDAEGWIGVSTIRTGNELKNIISDLNRKNRIWVLLSGEKLKDYRERQEMKEILEVLRTYEMRSVYSGQDGTSSVLLYKPDVASSL